MRPWQINIIMIIGVLLLVYYLPDPYGRTFYSLLILVTAIWSYFDARKLQVSKYKTTGLAPGGHPLTILIVVLLLWLVGFPLYISYRQRIIEGKVPLKDPEVPMPPIPE